MALRTALGVTAAALLVGGTTLAHANYLIDFEGDAPGPVANGFTSASAPGVHFTDTIGSGLQILDGGNQTHGHGLIVLDDDPSQLRMDFDFLATSIALDFGNDDPQVAVPGDLAVLTTFLGAVQVGQTTVVLNLDDIMNQTIAFSGATFDNALFAYTDATLNPINLIEVVDDIHITAAVPEPGTVVLLGMGLAALGFSGRRRLAP